MIIREPAGPRILSSTCHRHFVDLDDSWNPDTIPFGYYKMDFATHNWRSAVSGCYEGPFDSQ